jgi:hypothetical protein
MNYPVKVVSTDRYLVSEENMLRGADAVYNELIKLSQLSFSKAFAMSGSGEYRYVFNVELFIFRDLVKIINYIIEKVTLADNAHIIKLDGWEIHPRRSFINHIVK